MTQSQLRFLESNLATLGYTDSLRALDWMVEEMCAEKGFQRHNGEHYYYHLVHTTQDLLSHGVRSQSIITACLLHDVVEDVDGVTIRMIQDKFGIEVAEMVKLVTKDKYINYKEDEEAMNYYLSAILRNVGASLIKTSDKKHNFGTLRDATPEKKLRHALEAEKLFIPFFKDCRNQYPRYAGYFYSARTAIEPHLWEIKEHHEEVEGLNAEIERLHQQIADMDEFSPAH